MKPSLKHTLEYLRRAEIDFLQNIGSAERDEDIQAVKSEIDEFRNLVWSHTMSRGLRQGKRAQEVLEAVRMHRVVEMLRSLNTRDRNAAVDQASDSFTLADINTIVEEVCSHVHI